MHHAVTVEGVVTVFRLVDRVRAVAKIGAQQIFRQLSLHPQAGLAEFKRGRRINAVQVGIIEPINPGLGMLKFCDATNAVIGDRISRQVQCLIHRCLRPFACAAIGATA
ncbi:MAG: Uncharacterised protein [Halieaceae bacterium]|nr:MAG: Uncharacterised protein [Halieaceae bacterium]